MPDLGDFLGALLGQLAEARLHGDVETLRVADIYASHELLKHLPVPRFRMPEVRIDMPAVVEKATGKPSAPFDLRKTTASILDAVRQGLEDKKIPLTRAEDAELVQRVGRVLDEAVKAPAPPSATGVADRVTSALRDVAPRTATEEHAVTLREVRGDVMRVFAVARAGSTRISILPHTGAVREVPDADRLIRIHLVISEEAVEWTTIESESGPRDRLVQE